MNRSCPRKIGPFCSYRGAKYLLLARVVKPADRSPCNRRHSIIDKFDPRAARFGSVTYLFPALGSDWHFFVSDRRFDGHFRTFLRFFPFTVGYPRVNYRFGNPTPLYSRKTSSTTKRSVRYLIACDFDQTLSFNDSGHVLGEIVGIKDFAGEV